MGSTPLAHLYDIFLRSLDVEIDDNLVGQLTLTPQLHLVLDFHFALCTLLSVWVVQCALCWVCTVCTVQVTGSGEWGRIQSNDSCNSTATLAPNPHHAKISPPKMGNRTKNDPL